MLSFFFLALAAAPPVDHKPKLPPELDHIVQLANATAPEFAADALLRVAAMTKIDMGLRKELIDRAFHLAPGAQLRTPLAVGGQVADTSSGMVAAAAKLNLDTLSLQARAARMMIGLGKKAARDLFLEINPPAVEQGCDQPFVADIGQLYVVLAAVANQTFTEQERKKEEHLNLVMSYVSRAGSASEIAPIEQMIASLDVTPSQRDVLTTRVNGLRQTLTPRACPETKPADKFWTSDQAKRLFEDGVRLRSTKADTPEWRRQLSDYLAEVASWTPADEKDEATYFHQKAIIYEMLADLIPTGVERDNAIAAFVDFVANSNLQRDKPAEWFSHAQTLVTRARNSNSDTAKIWSAFLDSGNPVLVLYTTLERMPTDPEVSQR